MKELEAERIAEKATAIFVIERDPALILIYATQDEAKDAYNAILDFFNRAPISIHIRYNREYINLTIGSEHHVINIDKLKFLKKEMFQAIKPMANIFNGTDVMGRKHKQPPVIYTGVVYGEGIWISSVDSQTGLGSIENRKDLRSARG